MRLLNNISLDKILQKAIPEVFLVQRYYTFPKPGVRTGKLL